MGSAIPYYYYYYYYGFNNNKYKVGATSCHVISTALSLNLSHLLRRRLQLTFLIQPSHSLNDLWGNASRFHGINVMDSFNDSLSAASSCYMEIFGGNGNKNSSVGKSELGTSKRAPFSGRGWTNTLIIMNVLVFVAQIATKGKLFQLGAKINSLIDQGQLWRLVTASLLHADIVHLMVNCYSLNSIGPLVELFSGPRRYLAVYFTSAIAGNDYNPTKSDNTTNTYMYIFKKQSQSTAILRISRKLGSAMSYWLCKFPSVGASGAIFGLVGSFAVFIFRHRGLMIGGGKDELQRIARMVALNMVIGFMLKGIDNWGHLGGLLGGAATSWLIGPAWKYVSLTNDGRKVFIDGAPIFSLINAKST